MARTSKLLISACALLSTVARCDQVHEGFPQREPALVARAGSPWDAKLHLANHSTQSFPSPFNPALDSRGLVASWIGKRQQTCENPGYLLCDDGSGCCPSGDGCCPLGCCPTGKLCCTIANVCLDPGEVCCGGDTVCESGFSCCTSGTCYPNGGECCSTGYSCDPGNICVLLNGLQKCCTDTSCTAYVTGTVTISAPAQTETFAPTLSTAVQTTAFTASNTVVVQYTYYYYTITWYYYSWYYTVEFADQGTTSTYSTVTTYTTITVYASNSDAGYSSFVDISETLSLPTPAAATLLSALPSSTSATSTSRRTTSSPQATAQSSSAGGSGGASSAASPRAPWARSWGFVGFTGIVLGTTGALMVWI